MKYKGGVIFGIAFAMISFTVGYHVTRENTTKCPDYWVRIGTGCYLFAIPEILELDDSCKVDGCNVQEAIDYCTKHHGYLAEYQLYEEFEIIRSEIQDSFGSYWFWVGASNNEDNTTYIWNNNQNLLPDDSSMWDSEHPDNLPNRHCVLHTYVTSLLINYKCSGFAYPICERY